MKLNLENKKALVTGSTKGIGFAVAKQLAEEGAFVILNGRTEDNVKHALQQVKDKLPGAKIEGFAGDVATQQGADQLLKRFPQVDILVKNGAAILKSMSLAEYVLAVPILRV
jgi:NAD(P)-dependent dehydrogenase (short-subunit alcohol dehydrogenase family)